MTDVDTQKLLARWEAGDESAADEIFNRYLDRLIGLARSRLSEQMKRRVDAADVVQSVYRSFFRRARDGRYRLERGGDLWRLLAAITVNKVLRQVEFHQAGKRAIQFERSVDGSSWKLRAEAISREPSPDEAIAVMEELEHLMRALIPKHREILQLRLQGATVDEIANETGRTTRTVQRVMESIRHDLEMRLFGD